MAPNQINLRKRLNSTKLTESMRFLVVALIVFMTGSFAHGENAPLSLSCKQNVQLSLNDQGDTPIKPQVLLTGNYPDYSIFVVEIIDPPVGNNIATCDMIGDVISVMVTDTSVQPNNSCWSSVLIEDKLDPVIICDDIIVPCTYDITQDDPDLFLTLLYDNCTDVDDIDLWYSETITNYSCATPYTLGVNRTWYATDESGNTSSCTQTILLEKPSLDDVDFPADVTLSCPEDDADPAVTGEPEIDGMPIVALCSLLVWFEDDTSTICGGAISINREWFVMDWCSGGMRTDIQNIQILDDEPPILNCPAVVQRPTIPGECYTYYSVPSGLATDACAYDGSIIYNIKVNGNYVGNNAVQLYVGSHDVRVIASDPCGNTDSCDFEVIVFDNEVPSMACASISVGLDHQELITLHYSQFDGDYSDNCGIMDTMIRRVNDYCVDPQDLVFGDSVSFCCDDVGENVMVAIKVRDIHYNTQICMVMVEVQDLVPPEISCPNDITINCTQLQDSIAAGVPDASDNCDFTLYYSDEVLLDNCLEGTIERTWYAEDDFGNLDSCTQTITVENPFDFELDSVQWPSDTLIEACNVDPHPDSLGSYPLFNTPFCSNVASGYIDSILNPDSVCLVIFRTWVVYDSCDMVGLDSIQTIIIKNNAPPALSGPSDVTVFSNQNSCDAMVDLDAVTATDCSFGVVITNNYNNQGANIDALFPVGETLVTYTATDGCSNTSTYQVSVTVIDNVPPEITCPADIDVNNDLGLCGADVIVPLPDTSDNCGIVLLINDYTGTENASGFYPVGTTNVTYTVSDLSGNMASCSFSVTVNDTEDPSISCPANINVNNDPGVCGATIIVPLPDTSDNCGIVNAQNDYTGTFNASGFYGVGVTVVIWTVEDAAGNTATCSMTVTVNDTEDPIINCPDDISVGNDQGICGATVDVPLPDTSDNCGVDDVTNNVTGGFDASGFYPIGTTIITWTITDLSGNSATCSTSVTVTDTEDPMIDCPDDVTVNNDAGLCEADVTLNLPDTSDNCGVDDVTNDFNGGFDASGIYPVGTTIVVWTITDINGNSATCSTSVTVIDNEDPSITCPDDVTLGSEPGLCGADVTLTLPDTSDNCGVDDVSNDYTGTFDASGFYPVGTTIVTWTISDLSGNIATCSTSVTVQDTNSLTIICPDDITVSNDQGLCGAQVDVPLPDTSDNCGVESVINDYNGLYDASDFYPVGTTVVTWVITDVAGNTDSCSTTITVTDDENPEVTCPDNITVNNDQGECSADVTVPLPDTSDNCGVVSVINDFNGGINASGTYPVGTTTVTWTVMDAAGNSSTCSMTVTVIDNEAPGIVCPDNITVDSDPGECGADVIVPLPDTSDNCGVDSVVNDYNGLFDASDFYDVGITTVTWTIFDIHGNSATCSITVTVNDDSEPAIICPADIIVSTDPDICGAFVQVPLPDTSNDCGAIDSVFNDYNGDFDASDDYPIGTTVVTWTVINAGGNSSTCSVSITVNDSIPPVINCPDDITVGNDVDECSADVTVPLPDTSDNCGVATVINDFNGGFDASGVYPVGVTEVTWVITDNAGNVDSCSITITVQDTSAPVVIFCPEDVTIGCDSIFDNLDDFGLPISSDNCFLIVQEDTLIDIDDCNGSGTIERSWTFSDTSGNQSNCVQVITITGTGVELDSLDIIWPPEVIGVDICNSTDPDSIPGSIPEVNPDLLVCGPVSIVFEDEVITPGQIGCIDIERTWTVTDSCNFDPASGTGQWIFIQLINVIDTIPPTFLVTVPSDTFYAQSDTCVAIVNLISAVAEDCAGLVSLTNNSPFADSDGADASGVYPKGETEIVFIAEDSCGNVDSFNTTITVLDTTAPTFTCFKVLYMMNDSLLVPVNIYDLVIVLDDNCSDSASIILTFDPNDPTAQDTLLGCESVGEPEIHIYAIDEDGNTSVCFDTLGLTDDPGFCGPISMPIAGYIETANEDAVLDVAVQFNGVPRAVTDPDGFYMTEDMYRGEDVIVRPFKNTNPLENVSTFDLALIQRHILGLMPFENSYQYIAADINKSGGVDILDIIELRKLILGIYTEFPSNTSWRFVDADFDMTDILDPLSLAIPEEIYYLPLEHAEMHTDFVGVKIGDVSGTTTRSRNNPDVFGSSNLEYFVSPAEDGQNVEILLTLENSKSMAGCQFELNWGKEYEYVENSFHSNGLAFENIHFSENHGVRVSWNTIEGMKEDLIFQFELTAQSKSNSEFELFIDPSWIEPQAYHTSLTEVYPIVLEQVFSKADLEKELFTPFELYQNIPNPFKDHTKIHFQLPENSECTLEVLSATGQMIHKQVFEGKQGMNEIVIDKNSLQAKGIMYYRLQTEEFTAMKKMILLD